MGYNVYMKSLRASNNTLEAVFKRGTRLNFSKNETIISPNSNDGQVYWLESGFVKSYDITKYSEENLLVIREKHQIFPVLNILTDEKADIYYQTMCDVTVYRLDKAKYLRKMDQSSTFSKDVLQQVLTMYRIHSQRLLNLEYRTAAERIAFRIVTLADRFGEKKDNEIVIDAPIRHKDIAESINCSRETASREMAKLNRRGIISSSDGCIVITDVGKLLELVGTEHLTLDKFKRL